VFSSNTYAFQDTYKMIEQSNYNLHDEFIGLTNSGCNTAYS